MVWGFLGETKIKAMRVYTHSGQDHTTMEVFGVIFPDHDLDLAMSIESLGAKQGNGEPKKM